jgi:hypothetical protein
MVLYSTVCAGHRVLFTSINCLYKNYFTWYYCIMYPNITPLPFFEVIFNNDALFLGSCMVLILFILFFIFIFLLTVL